jgi:Arc/MetJ-type ribon-helix-helix transcriptional regulator
VVQNNLERVVQGVAKELTRRRRSVNQRKSGLDVLALTDGFSYAKQMEIQLTADQKAFVREAIESGRLQREEDAVQEALTLWEERERARAEILAAVDEAEDSLANGQGRAITQQSMRDLAQQLKQRGRDRVKTRKSSPR